MQWIQAPRNSSFYIYTENFLHLNAALNFSKDTNDLEPISSGSSEIEARCANSALNSFQAAGTAGYKYKCGGIASGFLGTDETSHTSTDLINCGYGNALTQVSANEYRCKAIKGGFNLKCDDIRHTSYSTDPSSLRAECDLG